MAAGLSSREAAAHFRDLAAAALCHSSTVNVVGGVWAPVLVVAVFPVAEEHPVQVEVVLVVAVIPVAEAEATLADRSLTNGGEKNAPIYV